jgi:transcriptional regulator with XRE-family HTH domain
VRTRLPRANWEWEFYRQLDANIVAARQAQGLTQVDLARKLGVFPAVLWYWEHGSRGMGVARLQLIADALGVTSTSLIPKIECDL